MDNWTNSHWRIIAIGALGLVHADMLPMAKGRITTITKDKEGGSNPDAPNETDPKWIVKENYGKNGRFIMDKDGVAIVYAINNKKPILIDNKVPEQTKKNEKITSLSYINNIVLKGDMVSFFDGNINVKEINGLNKFDTAQVTNMAYMFQSNSALKSVDLSSFDTGLVNDFLHMDDPEWGSGAPFERGFRQMFSDCSSLTSLDISMFDSSNVTFFSGMFSNCSNLTDLNISNLNLSRARSVVYLFAELDKLKNVTMTNTKPMDSKDTPGESFAYSVDPNVKSLLMSQLVPNGYRDTDWGD